jgi:hypothetical protein
VLRVRVQMHRRRFVVVGRAMVCSTPSPCLSKFKHVLEGIDGVVTDDRVMLVALAAFCNISGANGGMIDVVGCVGSCGRRERNGRAWVQLKLDRWNGRKLN